MFEPEDKPMGDATLKALTEKSNELQDLNNQVEELEMELGKLKASTRELSEITLKDGCKINTATYYSARITEENREEAFEWLDSNGFSDIIKNTVSISFGRNEDESAKKLVHTLDTDGYTTAQKKWVEPMTLKAFVREQVEKGSDLPLETFNVYIGQKTKVIKK